MEYKKGVAGKTFLFVDGTNLYAGQYQLFGPGKYLDFALFIKQIEDKHGITFDKIYFYASYTPKKNRLTLKEKKYIINEFTFYKSVKKLKKVVFFKGYRSKTSGKEKEVDVKLTADIISFAFLNKFDKVYLFTGDADFLQALFTIKKFHNKKKIYMVCLENKIMYQGLYFFKSYIIYLRNKPSIKREFKNVSFLGIDSTNAVSEV